MITQEEKTAEKFKLFSEVLMDLEDIILIHNATLSTKPNYQPMALRASAMIFSSTMMDKMWEVQEFDKMPMEDRIKMAESLGSDLRKIVYKYTNIDTTKLYDKAD